MRSCVFTEVCMVSDRIKTCDTCREMVDRVLWVVEDSDGHAMGLRGAVNGALQMTARTYLAARKMDRLPSSRATLIKG